MTRVLWLVRHGERRDETDSAWRETAERPYDPPLTETGRWQAERIGDRLRGRGVEAIYASPFLRTAETAHLIAEQLSLPVSLDRGLCDHLDSERFDVAPSILTTRALAERFDTIDSKYQSVVRPNYPETTTEATERTARAARRIVAKGPETILFVGHGLTVDGITAAFTGRSDVETPLGGVTKLVSHPWGWDTDLLADTSHLDA